MVVAVVIVVARVVVAMILALFDDPGILHPRIHAPYLRCRFW